MADKTDENEWKRAASQEWAKVEVLLDKNMRFNQVIVQLREALKVDDEPKALKLVAKLLAIEDE